MVLLSLNNVIITVHERDSGKRIERFYEHLPNIRSLKGFMAGIWDLSQFNNCFSKRNRLGDVDACVEQNGHTLIVEFKRSKNGMNKAQVLKAIRQAKYSNISTIFVFGPKDKPEKAMIIKPDPDSDKGFNTSGLVECNIDTLNDMFKDWTRYTEANNLVKNRSDEWNEVNKVFSELYSE
jgi:hypothetical protein